MPAAQNALWLFRWQGKVSRQQYFLAGVVLAVLKYSIDQSIAAHYGQPWHMWTYLLPSAGTAALPSPSHDMMMRVLGFVTLPFLWSGVALTIRRLRDVRRSPAVALLFFVPFVNIAMFIALCLEASRLEPEPAAEPEPTVESIALVEEPHDDHDGVLGVVIATALGLLLAVFGSRVLMIYAWGLFLGVPFLTGFVSGWIQNARRLRTRKETMTTSMTPSFFIGMILLGSAYEGAICLLMASPLALPISIAGALVAYEIQEHRRQPQSPRLAACIGILPLLMVVEYFGNLQPPSHPVTTSITINAPVGVVWKNVITFPALAPPAEAIFHTGIAYPTSATIVGSGPGAVRYCHFTTGDFVEPITTWDENHLLAFSVAAQPEAMREMSPWKVMPAHIEHNYFRSQHGQFRLQAIDANHTLLEGTTWYQDYFWPQSYWNVISDQIVHRIHMRVLKHVKQQAEMGLLHAGDLD